MSLGSTAKYNARARTLHWLIAIGVILNLITGVLHEPLEKTVNLMPFHKSVGLTILVLSVLRLLLRFTWTAPAYPAAMSRNETMLAKAMHVVLYFFMIAMPVTGWIFSSPGNHPLTWFGLFDWPKLAVTKGSAIANAAHQFHGAGGWVMLVLVAGHIGAALRHHFLLKNDVLRRML